VSTSSWVSIEAEATRLSQQTQRPLVLIEWVDSSLPASGWRYLQDQENTEPVICKSVGWLIKDEADCKVIVPHLGYGSRPDPYQGSGDIAIPSRCITRLTRLAERGKPMNSDLNRRRTAQHKTPKP
jgi:hypothetical protein